MRLKYRFRGSYTVEASVILSLLFFLIWFLIYLSFFMYDQCIIVQGSYRTALSAERMAAEDEKQGHCEDKYEKVVKQKLAGSGNIQKKIEIKNGDVEITTHYQMIVPAGSIFKNIWKISQKQTVKKLEPVRFIRNCRKAESIADSLQKG